MFQSSRIASGNCFLQASSACSPSSASTIWNSSPSRIRRATLRITLESSTTKHVFIAHPRYFRSKVQTFLFHTHSCRDRTSADVENAVDIDDDKQLSIQ